jgi:hypothetical protein
MRTIFHAADGRPSGSSLQAVDKEMDWIKCKSETSVKKRNNHKRDETK